MRRTPGFGSLLLSFAALRLTGCAPAPEEHAPARGTAAIVAGKPAPDDESVVIVANRSGGLCSGTVIADRVVLTAKHCVQSPGAEGPSAPSDLFIMFGPELSFGNGFRQASDVVTTPGTFDDGVLLGSQLMGGDVALITLPESAGVPAIPMKLTSPEDDVGKTAVAIGYGQQGNGSGQIKMRDDTILESVDDWTLFAVGTVCQGDSGGPLLNSKGEIIGVASYVSGGGCTAMDGNWWNRIDINRKMILGAIEKSASCGSKGPEACDGFDNDCDGKVDEDCLSAGETCLSSLECDTRLCAETPSGKVCTTRCDPLAQGTCPDGFACEATDSCSGVCVPGDAGNKSLGEPCEQSTECTSLYCADPGDGEKRCLAYCRGGDGVCLLDEACAAAPGSCGGCVGADLITSPLGQDEPCATDASCRSGVCHEDGESKYCTTACADDSDCDARHHCRGGACVRGARGELGGACVESEDCAKGYFCAKSDAGAFCTRECGDDAPCDKGFGCEMVKNGKVCLPDESLVGGKCEKDADCASGKCFEEAGVCTSDCASAAECGPGFECVRSSLGSPGACLDPSNAPKAPQPKGQDGDDSNGEADAGAEEDAPKSDTGDCSVGPGSSGLSALSSLWLLGLFAARRRRRG